MDRHIKAPLDREEVKTLEAGDYVYTRYHNLPVESQ